MFNSPYENMQTICFGIAAFYLWLLFGYLSDTVGCDIQRLMRKNGVFRHFVALLTFIIVFSLFENGEESKPSYYFIVNAIVLYVFFVLLSKNKKEFAIPVLLLICIERLLDNEVGRQDLESSDGLAMFLNVFRIILFVIIVTGFLSYLYKQRKDKKEDFTFYKFLFSTDNCRELS